LGIIGLSTLGVQLDDPVAGKVLAALLGLFVFLVWQCALPYLRARQARLDWSATSFPGLRIDWQLAPLRVAAMQVVDAILTLLSLGLYYPFGLVRRYRYRLLQLQLLGALPIGAPSTADGGTDGATPAWHTRLQACWPAALLLLYGSLAGMTLLAQWGRPVLAEHALATLPFAVDLRVGDAAQLSERQEHQSSNELTPVQRTYLDNLFVRLQPAHPRIPLRLLVINGVYCGPESFAYPNGTIVVSAYSVPQFPPLYAEADERWMSEALAASLAHDIAHVEHRDGMRTMLHQSLAALWQGAFHGDFSAAVRANPQLASRPAYTPAMESRAQGDAAAALQRIGMDVPRGFAVRHCQTPSVFTKAYW
jgi:hypothetical protein